MQTEIHSIVDVPGYGALYDFCCDLVESAPNRKLAAAALLNAAVAISMATMGATALADGAAQGGRGAAGGGSKIKKQA